MTTETTEDRVSRLEGVYDQIDKRLSEQRQNTDIQFGELREEIRGLRTEMRENSQELRGEIHGLRTEVNARFDRVTNVMIGGIIAVVGAVTASIVVNLINS